MFTGIIQEVGEISSIKKSTEVVTFEVQTKSILKNKKIGNSIAVNGVCVTITKISGKIFQFDAMEETLNKTNLNEIKKGSLVNLEPAVTLDQGLDGHLVQGHIDGIGIVENLTKNKRTILTIKFPKGFEKYLALKGSIAINGVSLTISSLDTNTFSIDLIPFTIKNTNLNQLKKDDKVNLEADMIIKYLERLLNKRESETKYEFLQERGFI